MFSASVLPCVVLSVLLGVPASRGNPALAPMCGDTSCTTPCTGREGPAAAATCFPPPAANSTAPRVRRDCYEHLVFGSECSSCNTTSECPDWCGEVRDASCRPYEIICGYVETVEFEGSREDLVTRGPLFCRRMDCDDFGPGEVADACWFTVDGHEVCCVEGVPRYVTGSGRVVPGFEGAAGPEAEGPAALAPGGVEPSAAAAVGWGLGAGLVSAICMLVAWGA
eukprot:jgi/Ulvmu1/6093/UM027_0071.1